MKRNHQLEIYNCEQGTDEWKQLRLGVITASKANDILYPGMRKTYKCQLLSEKLTGLITPFKTNEYMEWGTEHEDEARVRYEELTGNKVREIGFAKLTPEIGCSPDGLVEDDGLIEIKCPMSKTFVYQALFGAKKEYVAQMQYQMWVMDKLWCDFCLYDPRVKAKSGQIQVTRVYRDEKFINRLEDAAYNLVFEMAADMYSLTYKDIED